MHSSITQVTCSLLSRQTVKMQPNWKKISKLGKHNNEIIIVLFVFFFLLPRFGVMESDRRRNDA